MPIERLRPSFSFDEERIKELKIIAPEAFADGKINWETLKASLGEHLEDESGEFEHFGLFWPGKKEARKIASIPSQGTLIPVFGKGLKADGTPDNDGINDSHNIFIEGENLEVLKILQKSYAGRIKMIYIDPPYNTGNDFVYDDNFTEPLQEYLKRTGQTDDENKPLTTNKKADGRFHSKWLSMMYPRLKLARNLLQEDGIIFISIDDNEINQLRSLMNEIFGDENYIGNIIVQSNPRGSQSIKNLAITHEYILSFAKDITCNPQFGLELSDKMRNEYKLKDENDKNYRLLGLRQRGGAWRRTDRPSLFFPIYINSKNGNVSLERSDEFNIEVLPIQPTTNVEGSWRWSKEKIKQESSKIVGKEISRENESAYDIFQKDYLEKEGEEKLTKPKSIWIEKELNYQNGTTETKKLFDGKDVFSFPKPIFLIRRLLSLANLNEGDIVLDFFAGSGTTGAAVIEYNAENKNNMISFILVQMPEEINQEIFKVNFRTISEATQERIKRTIKINNYNQGFRTYKLDFSNFKFYSNFDRTNISELEMHFEANSDTLKNSWTISGLLNEIALIEGFKLDSSFELLKDFNLNQIVKISCENNEYSLFVCLDKKVENKTIESLELKDNSIFICHENAITDQNKLRLSDKGLIKTI